MSRTPLVGIVLAVAMMVPSAGVAEQAQTYDKLTYLTFSGTVQVPGVWLDAGTYRFRLINPGSSRDVMQVLSNDGATVHAMFFTRPDSRIAITDDPAVSFRETPAGVPPAIRSLFYGGERDGYEFVYPDDAPLLQAMETATVTTAEPLTTTTADTESATTTTAESATTTTTTDTATTATAETATTTDTVTTTTAETLPGAASRLPVVAGGGLVLLLAGFALGFIRRRL
jgi:hypothetical protein